MKEKNKNSNGINKRKKLESNSFEDVNQLSSITENCDCGGMDTGGGWVAYPVKHSLTRRSFIKKASILSLFSGAWSNRLWAAKEKVKLAFCGQLLCVVPYEVTRHYGYFSKYGLDVELVYTRGGGDAVRALIGDSVDYAASSLDAALGAFAKGAPISRFMVTGSLPLFALATSPKMKSRISRLRDLEGKTVGISKLGNSDHALLLFLISQDGGDASKVRFATLGTNLYEALIHEHVQAGMVQEPALTLINQAGGKTIANLMNEEDSEYLLGGDYEFMGVAVLNDQIEKRRSQMKRIAAALKEGVDATRTMPVEKLVEALPKSIIAGGDKEIFTKVLAKNRNSLYPSDISIDLTATQRVVNAHILSKKLPKGFDVEPLMRSDLDLF